MKQRLVPVDQDKLTRGRAASGMPKLRKIKHIKKLPAKKKPARGRTSRPVARRQSTVKTVAITEQPRDGRGRFGEKPPVDQRGFFGKLAAFFNGDMGEYIADCRQEAKRGIEKANRALLRETKANKSRKRG